MAEAREGGIPDGLGAGQPSKRAWHLAFRCHAVRRRTGGAGVVLLSATPAKNSPLEFYNAVALVDPGAFERAGVADPETFISRYCLTEQAMAQKPDGTLIVRAAVKAFGNLAELRDVMGDIAEFRTADEVGLRIPEALPTQVHVDLTSAQQMEFRRVVGEIEDIQEQIRKLMHDPKGNAGRIEALRMKIMGLSMRLDLVAIHPELPEHSGKDYRAGSVVRLDGQAPKLEACANTVAASLARDGVCAQLPSSCASESPPNSGDYCMACGHIIFVENVAVHDWLVRLLVERGVPRHRIAVLNAKVAKDPETRQQIAERFNGVGCPSEDEYLAPEFDVVIANSVAYEGVDLQRRTCAIHHIDLPWEPASLQQRNGRGVRQGALSNEVKIVYYLAKGSLDIRRLVKIDTKASWMKSLVASQDRVTNNPAAGSDLSVAELLAELASPEQRAKALAWAEQDRLAQEAVRKQRTARAANGRLQSAADRFARAGRSDAATAARLRTEAEAILAELGKVSADTWPWHALAQGIRDQAAYVPAKGPPLFSGTRLRLRGTVYELGRIDGPALAAGNLPLRQLGLLRYELHPLDNDLLSMLGELTPADIGPTVPWDEHADHQALMPRLGESGTEWDNWESKPWLHLPGAKADALWPAGEAAVVAWLKRRADNRYGNWTDLAVPLQDAGRAATTSTTQATPRLARGAQLVPPTDAGWRRWLELAEARRQAVAASRDGGALWPSFAEMATVAQAWWGRSLHAAQRGS